MAHTFSGIPPCGQRLGNLSPASRRPAPCVTAVVGTPDAAQSIVSTDGEPQTPVVALGRSVGLREAVWRATSYIVFEFCAPSGARKLRGASPRTERAARLPRRDARLNTHRAVYTRSVQGDSPNERRGAEGRIPHCSNVAVGAGNQVTGVVLRRPRRISRQRFKQLWSNSTSTGRSQAR